MIGLNKVGNRKLDDIYADEPQFYPQPKHAASADDMSQTRTTRPQKSLYRIPGPAEYNICNSNMKNGPSASFYERTVPFELLANHNGIVYCKEPDGCSVNQFTGDNERGKSYSITGQNYPCQSRTNSPGPCYNIHDVTRKGKIPGYQNFWPSFDYSDGWRHQQARFAVTDNDN